MSEPPVQLEYAPPGPSQGRLMRRWLLILLAVLAVGALAPRVAPFASRARVLWVQNRCANFEYPPDTVIFDSDRPERLLADAKQYTDHANSQVWALTGAGRNEPACWTSLKRELFGGSSFWPPGAPSPKALVHRLRNARGDERIVGIILAPAVPVTRVWSGPGELGMVAAIVRPGDWSTGPIWDGNGPFLACFDGAKRLRVFAGQADPADAARFTVRYEMDGKGGTIEGRLDDSANVTLRVVDGPATARATTHE